MRLSLPKMLQKCMAVSGECEKIIDLSLKALYDIGVVFVETSTSATARLEIRSLLM